MIRSCIGLFTWAIWKLISYGVDVDSKDSDEMSSIHTATEEIEEASDSVHATQWLLRKCASLKIRNMNGNNPLECALKKEEKKLDLIKVIAFHQHKI